MALQNDNSRISYLGNGSTTTPYTVPFYFFEEADLQVYLTDPTGAVSKLTLGSNYTVTGAGNPNGGAIRTAVAYSGSNRISIAREVAAVQTTVYEENDKFPAKTHERALDRVTMLAQQITRNVKRAFRFGDSQSDLAPIEAVIPNTLAGIDGDNQPKLYTIDQLLTLLSLPAPILNRPMKTFADDGGRAAAVPDFVGQLGTQQNTKGLYVATGLSAGNWAASTLLASAIHGQPNDGTISDTGEFLYSPNPYSAVKRGAFSDLQSWLASSQVAGTVVQTKMVTLPDYLTLNGGFAGADAVPLISEGASVMTASITPKSASNILRVSFLGKVFLPNVAVGAGLFRQGTSGAVDFSSKINSSNQLGDFSLRAEVPAATTDAVVFEVRVGRIGAAGAMYVNGTNFSRFFGGTLKTTLLIEEVKA